MSEYTARTEASSAGPGTARATVLFAIVGLLAYFSSLHGDYLLDDQRFTSDPNIGRPFHSSMAPRPLIALSLAVNYWIDGLNPRGYHALNLAVHVLSGIFLFELVRRALLSPRFEGRLNAQAGWIGLIAGLLWLAHPLNTQAVTYIIQRCESTMGLFFLASLWCYVRGATAERGTWWFAGSFLACALGAGCKEMMLTLAPLALLYDVTFVTGSWREALRRRWLVLGLLLVPPIVGILALALTGFFTDPSGTVGFGVKVFTPYTYALTQTEVILYYLRLAFVPVGLTLDYLDWKPCTSISQCWPSVAAVSVLVAVTTYGVWRKAAWAFPLAWFLVILAPTSSIVPVQDAAFEHRMYLPLAGLVALVVCGTAAAAARWAVLDSRMLAALGCAVILLLGLMTAARNEEYSSVSGLLADNAQKRPGNGRVRLNLAIQQFASGNVSGADANLNEAMRLPLQLPMLRVEHVKVLRESGRTAEAVQLAQQVAAERPESHEATYELGLSLLADNRMAEALPQLQRAAEGMPGNKFALLHYGVALQQSGQTAKAEAELKAARNLDPRYADQLIRTARTVALDPDAKPSHLRLASWYAAAACKMTVAPSVEFMDTYGITLARMGKFTDAVAEAKQAAALARTRGDEYLATRIEARMALFKDGKPYLPEQRKASAQP